MSLRVLVVGGGPGGSSVAYHLARRGHQVVLLDRQRFPRDKSCGDGLTRRAVSALDRMGVLPALSAARTVRGVATHVRGRGTEHLPYPSAQCGLVLARKTLDATLLDRARAAGAEVREGVTVTRLLRDADGVCGVAVREGNRSAELRAPVTVLAAGAGSRLGESGTAPREGRGFAVRTYLRGVADVPDELEVYLPVTEASDRYLLPSYGWLFPVDDSTVNVGIGLFTTSYDANLRALADRFLADLCATDPRLAGARADRWFGAPLRCDFAADRCAEPGLVRVGDAAGLVSPFTGEGIGYAVESGELAADLLHRNAHNASAGPLDLADYRLLMEREHAGYFEAGRRSVQRYRTVWHVLESTFDRPEPLFTVARRAVLYPEALGVSPVGHLLDDVTPLVAPGLDVPGALLAVGEEVYSLLRREWPFLARAWLGGQGDPAVPLRPALLTVLAARLGGFVDRRRLARLGAAVELSTLALLCHASVAPEDPLAARADDAPANWGNLVAVGLGDFLLTQAYHLACRDGAAAARVLAGALTEASSAQLREHAARHRLDVAVGDRLAVLGDAAAATFGVACALGGYLAGCDDAGQELLARYGRAVGLAHRLTDETRWWRGEPTSAAAPLAVDLPRGVYGLALPLAAELPDRARALRRLLVTDPLPVAQIAALVRGSDALDVLDHVADRQVSVARAALAGLPVGAAAGSLAGLADWARTRDAGPARDLRSALPAVVNG